MKTFVTLTLFLVIGAVVILHIVPIRQYSYLLSTVCHPNLLLNNGTEYRTENYRIILGQKDDYDKALFETLKLNIPQNTKLQSGCDYSSTNFKLYLL